MSRGLGDVYKRQDECDITIDLKSGLINIDGIKILEDDEVTADERVDEATSTTV